MDSKPDILIIGVWFIAAEEAVLDNFGGGTVQGGQGVTQGRGNSRNRIAGQEKDPDHYDVELTNAELFWQGIPLGSELTTKVTFTQLDKSATRQKPQSNGMWGEDVIQIMYDVPNNRVQVWKFEGKAWVQVGSDIPLKFVDGDVFTVFAGKDGTVEITRNGRLLSARQPAVLPITTPTAIQPSLTPTMTEAPIKQGASVPQLANFAPVSFKLPAPVSMPQQQSGSVTINYVYDPLYRLTEANYSTGDYYHYSYDAVGNRLTQETLIGSVPLTNTYVYDDANRLTSVDAVNYTWDNNGNLLNDGVNTYSYDSANRLTAISGQQSATYGYNGLGDRLTQNGVNYTLDLNAGLTQVLSDGTNTYLYGMGRIAEGQGSANEYYLGDALGSVGQLTDSSGDITLARTYEPYGNPAQATGSAFTNYGFTGEFTDASGLVYLRARYYAPEQGRFTTRDTWDGYVNVPASLNRFNYAHSNPVMNIDPSGKSLYDGICMGQVFSFGLALNMTAQSLINHCEIFYSQAFWGNIGAPGGIGPYNCNSLNQLDYKKPTTAGELFGDYICERGPDHVYFHGTDVLTHKLARSLALGSVRKKFYSNGSVYLPRHEEQFGSPSLYINEWKDLIIDHEFPLVHVMGSFWVTVNSTVGDRVRFQVENRTDLASGTHFIGRFPPLGQESTPYSLQSYVRDHPNEANSSAAWIVNTHPEIVSILDPLRRSQTGPGMGGGNFEQTFTWTERNLGCWADLPWPIYIYWPGLDVGNDTQVASIP